MASDNTRLKFISSKDAEKISQFLNQLTFKVEIKQLVIQKGVWFCWFVIPDTQDKFKNINLD